MATLPNIGEVLAPILGRVAREQQPLLIALAERRAAERYRGWATESAEQGRRSRLLECAEREERIAERVEALYPDADAIQRRIVADNPDLETVNRTLFASRPVEEQFTIQAQGERLGAATWRAFARAADRAEVRDTFLACATLEEESAVVLEAILAGTV
jgi:hypothetical protein